MKHDPKEVLSAVDPQAMSAATAYKTLLVPVDAMSAAPAALKSRANWARASMRM